MKDSHQIKKGTNKLALPPIDALPALSMGLQGCAPEQWLDGPDAFGDQDMKARQLGKKQILLSARPEDVFACLAAGKTAAEEATSRIAAHLRRYNKVSVSAAEAASLQAISGLIPEDILILTQSEQTDEEPDWLLSAAVLCFPSHWRLSEKIGQSVTAIHDPVPGFAERLAQPVNRFFTTMKPGPITQRMNWSIQTGDQLHTPERLPARPQDRTAEEWGAHIHIRTERQCFYKLPETGAVVFTIRTSLAPLNRFRAQPEFVQMVLEQARTLSPAFQAYKAIAETDAGMKAWIDKYLPCKT